MRSETCFHCGLPSVDDVPQIVVLGESRNFCCAGCHAVCEAIQKSGLEDYYRYRTATAINAEQGVLPDFLSQLDIYDRPEVQKGFVYSGKNFQEANLILEEIRCPACLWLNERYLRGQTGVMDVSIDSTTQRLRIRWDPGVTQLSQILRAITDIGYVAHPYDARHSEALLAARRRRNIERLIYAGLLGMMVMQFSIATYVMGDVDEQGNLPLWVTLGRWTSLLVSITLLAYPAQDFWVGAWNDLRHRRLGMDVPIVFGLSAAFLGSLTSMLSGHGEVYFDSIAMFVFFVLVARYFETRGRVQAVSHVDRLTRAVPQSTWKKDIASGEWHRVSILDITSGDVVRVLAGEAVPVDGIIIEGRSSFDESLLTGESMPVMHAAGEAVIAGSINGDQSIMVRVEHTGQDTLLDSIRRLIDKSMERKPRVALLAEKVARGFVAVILLIAVATAGIWWWLDPAVWLSHTIAVLIVTCPCALALATPVAMSVSVGRFVEMGILPLRADAMESLATANVVVFDKTGTLTLGHPRLLKTWPTGKYSADEVLNIAGAMSCMSEHPVARAFKQVSQEFTRVVDQIENIPGQGIRATIDQQDWRLGKLSYAFSDTLSPGMRRLVEGCQVEGHHFSVLANEEGIQAVFTFVDALRPGARQLIHELRDSGVEQFRIFSGDASGHVMKVANETGIVEAYGNMTPADKLSALKREQDKGNKVLMLGDGINDAPVLAAADVSVSFSAATDLASISSDFLLLQEGLSVLAKGRRLAIRTRSNIRQNIIWAISYNVIAVPLAALGFVPPWMAAIGMSASSLIVVFNALRLKR